MRMNKIFASLFCALFFSAGAIADDDFTERAIEAIENAGKTGKIGDGKIFISDLTEVIRIRTGETGKEAL